MGEERGDICLGEQYEPCPKCRWPFDREGWCRKCSERRQMALSVFVALMLMFFGLAACSTGFRPEPDEWVQTVVWIGGVLLCGGPIVGLIIFGKRRKSKK